MAIAEIVTEIDAYLLRLRQARKLLASSDLLVSARSQSPQRRAQAKQGKDISSGPIAVHVQKSNKRQSAPPREKRPNHETVDSPISSDAGMTELQTTSLRPSSSEPPSHVKKIDPAGRSHSHNVARPKRQTQVLHAQSKSPANQIAGATPFRVVVVSPEELRKARELTANPVAKRQHTSISGLTGRSAFEALFEK